MIVFSKMGDLLTNPTYRGPIMRSVMLAVMAPLQWVYERFLEFQVYVEIESRINSQTAILEWAINKKFDPTEKRLKIIHSEPVYQYAYNDDETGPIIYLVDDSETFNNEYIYSDGEESIPIDGDFLVKIPQFPSMFSDDSRDQLEAYIKKYKFSGKSFEISRV